MREQVSEGNRIRVDPIALEKRKQSFAANASVAKTDVLRPHCSSYCLGLKSQITGPAPTSGSTCNGNYNGTFNGTITVSAGQNCAFFGGGVNGNGVVNGGQIALSNSTVSGNMAIQGGSGFSLGPGTNIVGTLSILDVGSGSTASQICQATVSGNLEILGNAIPLQIGNPQNSCFGSSSGRMSISRGIPDR